MKYTPGIINDVSVVLCDGDFTVTEEMCLKLNDYEALLVLLKRFDEQMTMLNTYHRHEDVWYQLPSGLIDAWHDASITIKGVESRYRIDGK